MEVTAAIMELKLVLYAVGMPQIVSSFSSWMIMLKSDVACEEGGGLIECAQAVVSGAVEDAAKEPLDDKDRVNGEKIGEAAVTGGAIEGVRECT